MNRISLTALAVTAALALTFPAAAATKGPAAGKTVSVGVIADVTGASAVYGTQQREAYQLANDDLKAGIIDAGGMPTVLVQRSSRRWASAPDQVINLMQKFTTDGTTPLVLGPTLSGEAFRAFPIAKAASCPVIGTSTTAEGVTAIGPTIFRISLAESQAIPTTVARTFAKWHYKTAAVMFARRRQRVHEDRR